MRIERCFKLKSEWFWPQPIQVRHLSDSPFLWLKLER